MSGAKPDSFWAGGFLYHAPARSILLHKRDGNTKASPNKWAFFGGHNEGAESHIECFIREMKEEIGLVVRAEDARPLCEYMDVWSNRYRVVYYIEAYVPVERLVLGEGAGLAWHSLDEVDNLDLSDRTRDDMKIFRQKIG